MVCRVSVLLGAAVALSAPPAPAAPVLDECLVLGALPERVSCVGSRLASEDPGARLSALVPLIDSHADTVARLLAPAPEGSGDSGESPRLRAARLDLLGQALMKLDRLPEAADALAEALEQDDGTLRIRWRVPEEGSGWDAALGPGGGRLERTARALLRAGRPDAARPLLARGLVLGAGEWAREAWSGIGGGAVPGLDPRPSLLDGPQWCETLPDLEIRLHGGESRRLRDAGGNVLLLDFWASWCPPCLRELPFIESLYRSRKDRGLDVLAINYGEAPSEVQAFAVAQGLTLPIGMFEPALETELEIRSVPTVIVADRGGAIRGRWAGYEGGIEERLTGLVDELLDRTPEEREALGRIRQGAGTLEVQWVRVARRDLDGAAFVRADTGPRIAVALARSLTLFDAEGREDRTLTRPQAASKLRSADLNGDGVEELLGFRPGSNTVFVFELIEKKILHWKAPHPVFDVAAAALGREAAPAVLLGTLEGLWRAAPDGTELQPVEGFGTDSGICAGARPGAGLTLLENGRLHWLDGDLKIRHTARVAEDAWTLAAAPGLAGAGAASADVVDTASGRFLRAGGPQIAFGLGSGQLVIVDPATGASLFRAAFEAPIRELAAGDLDGDGLDELLVVQQRKLALLKAVQGETRVSDVR